jgi:gliding motility-associated-like protein
VLGQPVADFSATPVSGCAPLLVKFTDLSTDNPTSWKWDLGNGTTSILQNPSVTYFASGRYNITLISTNASGSDTIVKNQYITVQFNPIVKFSGNTLTGCLPLSVKFTDQSTAGSGTINSWKWDFGDGLFDSVRNPNHTYTSSGTFDVALQVKNSFGCTNTISLTKYINTSNSPKADFTNNLQSTCKPPVKLNFQNLSTGPPSTYQWDFGDGSTSTQTNPSHTYSAAGSFTVKLIASAGAGGCTNTIQKVITIGTVKADFNSPLNVCQGQPFSLSNTSVPGPASVLWNFGDGTTSDLLNPVKTYNTSGNLNIKMIAGFGACTDSISKPITVLKQSMAFTADDTIACDAPFTVKFTSNVPGATSLIWNFGDGTTSTNANPTHTYNSTGGFDVSLIATSSLGCKDTLLKQGYIKIQIPAITLTGLPAGGCVPFTNIFSAAISTVDPVAKYDWNFGDGMTDTAASPSHTFNTTGKYDVVLTITTAGGCIATTNLLGGVRVGNTPSANFSATPLVTCVGTRVNFTDLSTGNIDDWLWDFGDQTTSTSKNPRHTYQDTGYFSVKLVAFSNGCPDSITLTNYIYVKPPVGKFSIKNNCAFPYLKRFSNNSISADTYLWDFGDGATSTSKTPTHNYADTGTYTVKLIATNLSTGCQDSLTRTAKVVNEKAMFVANDTSICKNTSVTFRSQNIDITKVSSYDWDFGDGSTVTTSVDSISHTYTTSGAFNVGLIITNVLGCRDTLVKPNYIKTGGPTANFKTNQQTACFNTGVNFIDSSLNGANPIVTWTWSYGDSITETLVGPPFTHFYANAGIYTIKLKVTDGNGCFDSLVKPNYLLVSKPVADFFSPDPTSCPLAPIKFINSSQGTNPTYLWNFGDGNVSDSINPVHQYAYADTFNVSLKITDQYGCGDSLQKINYIGVSYPRANFTLSDSVSACPPLDVKFNSSSINYTSLFWDFGDGNTSSLPMPTHFYTQPGNYTVRLRAANAGGCFDEKSSTIVIKGPTGVLSYTNTTGCDSVITNFKATAINNISFTWDFNDGNTVKTTDSIISYAYTRAGLYLPKLILEDINGCMVPIQGADTIKVFNVQANFTSSSKTLCDAGIISFSDSSASNDVITDWRWNFGDASASSQQNPSHYYSSPGVYTVSLVAITAKGCTDTIASNAHVSVVARPDISIRSNTAACKSDTLIFNGVFLQPDTSTVTWQWDFANGQTSALQNPMPQIYNTAGNYIVSVVATNINGCKDTAIQNITINALPNTNAGNDASLCLGATLQLQASGAIKYQWITPTNFLSCTNCSNPVTSSPDDITYLVRGTDAIGCSAVDSVIIKVKKPFTMTIIPNADSVCIGDGIQLNASYAENYLWTPANTLNNAFIGNPIASPTTNTTYKVVGYDSANCFKDSAFVDIAAFNKPSVEAGPDKTIKSGSPASISAVYSNDITSWRWTPPKGLDCSDCPTPVANPNTTTTYTIEVENSGGCISTDKITIFTTCTSENIFIPNTFSPNGDGVNDIFYPRGRGINKIKGMKIFNRWGEIVFERSNFFANDPALGWNGLIKGKKAPADVYVFIIEVICDNTDLVSQNGNITLLR